MNTNKPKMESSSKEGADLYKDIFDNPDKYNNLICTDVWYFEEDKIDDLESLHFSKTCEDMISNLSGYWYDFYDGDEISDANKDFLGLAEYYSDEDEQHIFAVDTSDPNYPVHCFNHETGFERVSKSLQKFIADCINLNTPSK